MSSMKTRRGTLRCACALALGLALAAPGAAFAAPADASGSIDVAATGAASPSSTITGTIHATTLKVTVPTVVAFDIDPGATAGVTKDATTQKRGQYTSPANYTIKNYSAVDVYGYVSKVEVEGVTLVDQTSALKKTAGKTGAGEISAMVGLCDKDEGMSLGNRNAWLMADATKYYAFNKTARGKLAASENAPTDEGGTATMYIYGAVKNGGWAENDSFKVKPTFKISVTDPS